MGNLADHIITNRSTEKKNKNERGDPVRWHLKEKQPQTQTNKKKPDPQTPTHLNVKLERMPGRMNRDFSPMIKRIICPLQVLGQKE